MHCTLETVLNAAHIKIMASSLTRQAGVFDVHSCLRMPAGSPETAVVATHPKEMAGSFARQAGERESVQTFAYTSWIFRESPKRSADRDGWQLGQAGR